MAKTENHKINFRLPLPPSKNKQHAIVGNRVYNTKAVKDYQKLVEQILRLELQLHKIFIKESKIVIWCS